MKIYLKAGTVFCTLGENRVMMWQRIKLAINNKVFVFFLTSEPFTVRNQEKETSSTLKLVAN